MVLSFGKVYRTKKKKVELVPVKDPFFIILLKYYCAVAHFSACGCSRVIETHIGIQQIQRIRRINSKAHSVRMSRMSPVASRLCHTYGDKNLCVSELLVLRGSNERRPFFMLQKNTLTAHAHSARRTHRYTHTGDIFFVFVSNSNQV